MFWKKRKYIALNCIFYTLVKHKLPEDGGHNFIHTEYFTKENINDQILRLLTVTLVWDVRIHARFYECSFNMSLEMLLFLPLQRSVSLNSTLAF